MRGELKFWRERGGWDSRAQSGPGIGKVKKRTKGLSFARFECSAAGGRVWVVRPKQNHVMNASINPIEGKSSRWNVLSLFGARSKSRLAPAAPPEEPVPKPASRLGARRILVVDDDAVVLKTTEIKLKAHGYAVSTAVDGPSAIHAARSEQPDLILLDLGFPPDLALTWDGFSIMNWLRRLESSKNTPIIIFTGGQEDSLYQRARAAGAAGFFHKPLDYAPLLALIDLRLKSSLPSLPADNRHGEVGNPPAAASGNLRATA